MNEEIELTEREENFIAKMDGKTELVVAKFYVVYPTEKRRVKDIFEGIVTLREKEVEALEIYTVSGIKIVTDKNFDYHYREFFSIPD